MAIVLGNGPHMAAAFVTIAAGATTAPLNPAYRADEFEFYLNDLQAKTLLVERGVDSPARAVAQKLGVPIVELCPDPASGAGAFTLEPLAASGGRAASAGAAEADDIALILHTSGTTSRPKMVPLTQRNITASARHIVGTLQLSPDDTCLNVMPLFHIHGLMAAVLSSLAAGAQVWCSPGFNPLKFFGWLDEVRPSWYTAVPTMHQTILARVQRNPEAIERSRLRLIRSSSASLPSAVMGQLEERFRAPVIESYGMTEASHQMASNPLPPRERKPGSVGVAAGPEVAVMDEQGTSAAAGIGGRSRDSRAQRHARLHRQPGRKREGVYQRMVPHRRSGRARRRRVSASDGPAERADQPGRREDLADRSGRSVDGSSRPCSRW